MQRIAFVRYWHVCSFVHIANRRLRAVIQQQEAVLYLFLISMFHLAGDLVGEDNVTAVPPAESVAALLGFPREG